MLLIDLPSHPHPQKLKKVPNTVLRVDNKSGVFIRGLRIPPRFSPCETHSREMAKSLGFDPSLKVKTCFDCKMFDFANWVFRFNGEHGSRVTPSHEALSFSLQGPLRYPCWTTHPSLVRDHFSSPRVVPKSRKHVHFSNSVTIKYFTAILNISTSTPSDRENY